MKQKEMPVPVLTEFFNNWKDWWQGWNERDASRDPDVYEKRQMARYPICNSIAYFTYLPMLMPHVPIDGDERQVEYLKHWFENYYYLIMDKLLKKGVIWGYAIAERINEVVYLDNKSYWMHTNILCPESYNAQLQFTDKPPSISSFKWGGYTVNRYTELGDWQMPGMVYYSFRGNELSAPQGESIFNDCFWAWQLVMKMWTNMLVYQKLHAPIWKLYYPIEEHGDTEGNKAVDAARNKAIAVLDNVKNANGITLPRKLVQTDGKTEMINLWDLVEEAAQDREINFLEAIKTLNTMMYVSALIPERLIEQFKDTGSYSMVQSQKDFYTQNIIKPRLKMLKNILSSWFIGPMLEVNFGKIDCTFDLQPYDESLEFYYQVIDSAIKGGQLFGELDMRAIAERANLPVSETQPQPTVETAERKHYTPGIEMQTKRRTNTRVKQWADKWVKKMDKGIQAIKEAVYKDLKNVLYHEQMRVGMKVMSEYDKGIKSPTQFDAAIQKAVQIPHNVFSGIKEYLYKSWDMAQRQVVENVPPPYGKLIKPMQKPSKEIDLELRRLAVNWHGSDSISGEGEVIEKRLYTALMDIRDKTAALHAVDGAIDNYIKITLPTRLVEVIHDAAVYGVKDAITHVEVEVLKKKGEQK